MKEKEERRFEISMAVPTTLADWTLRRKPGALDEIGSPDVAAPS